MKILEGSSILTIIFDYFSLNFNRTISKLNQGCHIVFKTRKSWGNQKKKKNKSQEKKKLKKKSCKINSNMLLQRRIFSFKKKFLKKCSLNMMIAGLPHTQGTQENSESFKVEENLRES